MANAYAVDWGVTAILATVTSATYRGLDYREPTYEDMVRSIFITPTETPFLSMIMGKKGRRVR